MPGVRFLSYIRKEKKVKGVILSVVFVAFFSLTTQEAQACSCLRITADGPTDPAAIESMIANTRKMYETRGGAIFIGKVLKVEKVKVKAYNRPLAKVISRG